MTIDHTKQRCETPAARPAVSAAQVAFRIATATADSVKLVRWIEQLEEEIRIL